MFSRDLEQMFQPIRKRCRLPLKPISVCKSTKKYLLQGFKQVSFYVKNVTLQNYTVHHTSQMSLNLHKALL